ncbi:hypothetical protein AA313_de0202736 [Arthrobotrys entomopaga]|nr:hypothetical protein AA313_de0202736 [Arthrobotrys entomopaga]
MDSVEIQCTTLRNAWKYDPQDHILHVLPTHHIHGLVNALLTPLSSGSSVEFTKEPFDARKVLKRISSPTTQQQQLDRVTMFHGVPTMYSSFLSAYDTMSPSEQAETRAGLKRLRVAVCGSAALPVPVAERWKQITGEVPLERYGMTETGMTFSNSLNPEDRIIGSVGYPMAGIKALLLDHKQRIIDVNGVAGNLAIQWEPKAKGRSSPLFTEYWNKRSAMNKQLVIPEEVKEDMVERYEDNKVVMKLQDDTKERGATRRKLDTVWFKTGDMAKRGPNGEMILLGRSSVDIINVGGHLVSALEIERKLLTLEGIGEAAVIGLPSEKFGHIPAAVVALKPDYAKRYEEDEEYRRKFVPNFRKELRAVLSSEKLPRVWHVMDKIPKNQMGKVNKVTLSKAVFPETVERDKTK